MLGRQRTRFSCGGYDAFGRLEMQADRYSTITPRTVSNLNEKTVTSERWGWPTGTPPPLTSIKHSDRPELVGLYEGQAIL